MIAAGDASWEAEAVHELEASAKLRLVRRCVDVADLLAAADSERAVVAIISVDLPGLDVDTVHRLERSGVRVAAVNADPARCAALGITRLVQLGGLDDVTQDAPAQTVLSPGVRSPVAAVWGPAGAPGRSVVALSIAAATAAAGTDTVLVDADTYGGALGQLLGVLDDVSGLAAACRAANNGRAQEVVEQLLDIAPGLRLLSGLPRGDMWTQVRPGALDVVLAQLRAAADLVVVDCGPSLEAGQGPSGRNQATLQVLEQADSVVVVGRPDPVGLSRLVRGLHDLAGLLPQMPPIVVLNQMRSSLGWSEREVGATVSRLTGHEPFTFLPFDQSGLDLAAMRGLSPRETARSSPFVVKVEDLAGHVVAAAASGAVLAAVLE